MKIAEYKQLITKPTEHLEQVKIIQYCDLQNIPIYAIPNGANKSKISGAKFKAEGLRAGMCDLCIPVAKRGYSALYIELKVKGGSVKPNQREWINRLISLGNCALICWSADEAIKEINSYFNYC